MSVVGPYLRAATDDVVALAFGRSTALAHVPDSDGSRADLQLAATIHGLGPLLGQRVARGELTLDPLLDAWLLEQAAHNRARLEMLHAELLATLDALRRAHARCLPLKGAALLLRDGVDAHATRPMADLDVLIEPLPALRVDLALADAGWCFSGAQWKHRTYRRCGAQPAPPTGIGEHPLHPRALEAHVRVVEQFRGYRWDITPQLLRNTESVNLDHFPDRNALALHLGIHASMSLLEGMTRAAQLLDLQRAVASADVEWLLDQVHSAGFATHARFLFPAVAFVARELNDPQCALLADALRANVPRAMAAWADDTPIYDVSWAKLQEGADPRRFDLWARNPRERARMALYKLAPSPAALSGELHAGDGPLPRQYARHYRHLARRTARHVRIARR
jgi:hypothetical protein